MAEITIVVSPSFDRRGKRRHGRFDARLQGCDEIICEGTQQPLLDASRVLLRGGFDPSTVICKVRSNAPTIVTMRAPIGVASRYTVMGQKFVRRKPDAGPIAGSGIENPGSGVPVVPRGSNAALEPSHRGTLRTANSSQRPPSSTRSPTATTTTGN
jgi:hypothetical protein